MAASQTSIQFAQLRDPHSPKMLGYKATIS